MTTDRLLVVLGIMRITPARDEFALGFNAALESLAKHVELEDTVMAGIRLNETLAAVKRERAARLADFAEAEVIPHG